jgi:hypothetical protein
MRLFDVVKEMKKNDLLRHLIAAGFIGSKASTWFDIVVRYEEEVIKHPNKKRIFIAQDIAQEFGVEQTTVYRARKIMLSDLQNSANDCSS